MSNTPTEGVKYKDQLLDHLIDAVLDAIKRARAAWLLGVIIVFVFSAAVFNATLSWNASQIERRAKLYNSTVQGYDEVKSLTGSDPAIDKALNRGDGELGYLSPIWKSCQNISEQEEKLIPSYKPCENISIQEEKDKCVAEQNKLAKAPYEKAKIQCVKGLKETVFTNLDTHVKRMNAFDTISIPFIGVSVTATDFGIVGGVALIIVGYWLLAMLRREHLVLKEFVNIGKAGALVQGLSKFGPNDLVYACQRIKHYMVFSAPEPGSPLGYVATASFFAAPFLLILNHILTVKDIYSKGLAVYWHWHIMAELLVAIIGVAVWIKGWLYQYRSMKIMQLWELECREKKPFQNDHFMRERDDQ